MLKMCKITMADFLSSWYTKAKRALHSHIYLCHGPSMHRGLNMFPASMF